MSEISSTSKPLLESMTVAARHQYQCECFARFVISMGFGARAPKARAAGELPPTWQEVGRKMWPDSFARTLQQEMAKPR